jgi:outer membrane protein OmpA-like peptidoglycan-associated protein
MKKLLTLLSVCTVTTLSAQYLPSLEVGAGLALKHTEGFYIPRYTVSGLNLYKGLGFYTTYEQRNNVTFVDDINGDGKYQRYTMGPTVSLNENLYGFAGLSPLGPYGLSHSFGKVRKEVGIGLIFNPITLRIGYSNWVGTTVGLHYRFGSKNSKPSYQEQQRQARPISIIGKTKVRVDTVTVTVTDTVYVKQEVVREVVKEIEKSQELTLVGILYHKFNSIDYTDESLQSREGIADALKKNPSANIVIVGHTDEIGSDSYNYTLGLNRAQKLANYLVNEHGIPATQIEVRSEGKESPYIETDNSKNRRVEIYFKN